MLLSLEKRIATDGRLCVIVQCTGHGGDVVVLGVFGLLLYGCRALSDHRDLSSCDRFRAMVTSWAYIC